MTPKSQEIRSCGPGGESVPTGLVWPSPEAEEKLREVRPLGSGERNGFPLDEGQGDILEGVKL